MPHDLPSQAKNNFSERKSLNEISCAIGSLELKAQEAAVPLGTIWNLLEAAQRLKEPLVKLSSIL